MGGNIQMDRKKMKCKVVGWIHMAQDRDQWSWTVVNMTVNLLSP